MIGIAFWRYVFYLMLEISFLKCRWCNLSVILWIGSFWNRSVKLVTYLNRYFNCHWLEHKGDGPQWYLNHKSITDWHPLCFGNFMNPLCIDCHNFFTAPFSRRTSHFSCRATNNFSLFLLSVSLTPAPPSAVAIDFRWDWDQVIAPVTSLIFTPFLLLHAPLGLAVRIGALSSMKVILSLISELFSNGKKCSSRTPQCLHAFMVPSERRTKDPLVAREASTHNDALSFALKAMPLVYMMK